MAASHGMIEPFEAGQVREALLGRVIDGAGRPLDGMPEPACDRRVRLAGRPINPLSRQAIRTPLDVGVRSINALLTAGNGQRLGLFAGSGVGNAVREMGAYNLVAIVDEEAILQSDLDREVELYKMEKEYAGEPVPADTPEVRREMLDRLIESKLIIAAAKQADMNVDEEAIEQSVQEKIDQFVENLVCRWAIGHEGQQLTFPFGPRHGLQFRCHKVGCRGEGYLPQRTLSGQQVRQQGSVQCALTQHVP